MCQCYTFTCEIKHCQQVFPGILLSSLNSLSYPCWSQFVQLSTHSAWPAEQSFAGHPDRISHSLESSMLHSWVGSSVLYVVTSLCIYSHTKGKHSQQHTNRSLLISQQLLHIFFHGIISCLMVHSKQVAVISQMLLKKCIQGVALLMGGIKFDESLSLLPFFLQ